MTMESNEHDPVADQNIASVSDSDAPRHADDVLDRDPFEELASEFSERHRRGEMPSVEEYAQKYPELAEEIRDLFPTIAAMEQLKERRSPSKPTLGGMPLERLGDFRILGEIGRGGMGVVYEAEQVSLGRHVAVKVLPKQALLDERHLRRFEREAQTAAKLHHTNIVPVFGVGQQDGYHYIVMQFIPGVGLDEILIALRTMVLDDNSARFRMDSGSRASHANHNAQALLDGKFGKHASLSLASSFTKAAKANSAGTQPIGGTDVTMAIPAFSADSTSSDSLSESSPTELKSLDADSSRMLASMDKEYYRSVAKIGQQVADALAYAHEQGTLHRDIKPGNLLLDGAGTVWVADFGLAKLVEQENVSRTGDIVGTLSYMPPESFSGDVDARGDIYALGLTLYEMLAMRPAYYGRDRAKLVKQITDGDLPRLGKLNPSIPRDLETIVLKAIEQRPEDRYATAREFEVDLQSFLIDMPIMARRMSVPEQFTRWCRKNKLVASLSAAVLTLLVLSSATFGALNWQANVAKQDALDQKEIAEEQTIAANVQKKIAIEAQENARKIAHVAVDEFTKAFSNMFPVDRLPLSADQTVQSTQAGQELNADELTAADLINEETSDSASATVAAAPITAESAAQAEKFLEGFVKVAESTGNDEDFAPTFASITMQVGKLHKMLGHNDEALKYFESCIAKYESIVNRTNSPSAIVGLASSYNEKGDVLALTSQLYGALPTYRKSLELLKQNQDVLGDDPRAIYERARTLFLMSMERRGPRRPGGPRPQFGRTGRGGPGNLGGRQPEESGRERGGRNRGGPGRGQSRPGGPERPDGLGPDRPEFALSSWDPATQLRQAIELLIPLVESETNPEYRYLLARCYTGLSLSSPGPNQRQENNKEALKHLEQLVRDQPDVADYKFEYAVAQFFSLGDVNVQERVERTREIVKLTTEIATNNPGVSDYAIVNARGLWGYVEALDRLADEAFRRKDSELLNLRKKTQQAIIDATAAFESANQRFPEAMQAMSSRYPSEKEVAFFNDKVAWKYQIAEARSLKQNGENAKATVLLESSRDELRKLVDQHVNDVDEQRMRFRRPPGPYRGQRKVFEYIQLLAATELELSGIDSARKLLEQIKQSQRNALDQDQRAASWRVRELDLAHARVKKWIGDQPLADEELSALKAELTTRFRRVAEDLMNNSSNKTGEMFVSGRLLEEVLAGRVLEEVLAEMDDESGLEEYRELRREVWEHLRPRMRERENGRRPGGRGGPGRPNADGQPTSPEDFSPQPPNPERPKQPI